MNDFREIVRRIGGQHALSWPSFWIVLAINVAIYMSSNLVAVHSGMTSRLAIVGASQLALYSVPLLVWLLWVRKASQPRPTLMFSAYVVGAVLRALVIVGAPYWVVSDYQLTVGEFFFRLSASVAIMSVTLAMVAVYNDLTFENAERSAELARLQRDAAAIDQLVSERMQDSQREVIANIRGQLERLLQSQNGTELVAELRLSVDDVVRPLSHGLAATIPTVERPAAELTRTRIPWPDLLSEVGRIKLFMPTVAMIISLVMAGPWVLVRAASSFQTIVFLASVAASWLVLQLGNVLWLRLRLRSAAAVVTVATLMAITLGLAWLPVFHAAAGGEVDLMVFVALAYFMASTWFLSLPRAADRLTRAHSAAVDEAIAQLHWEMARAQAAAWLQQRNFAYALHGPLQSVMTASIFKLEAALAEGELGADLRADIEGELMATLESVTTTSDEVSPLANVVDDIRRLWSGIVAVEFAAESSALAAAETDQTTNTVLVDVTREACSNAVRHGKAKRIEIQLAWSSSNVLELTIVNDGIDLPADMSSGLGTQLLDEATISWSRFRRGDRTVLSALVPVATLEYAI